MHLQPSTQPVTTADRRHGPAQGVSFLSTKPQKAPPSPQESDAAIHPPLTWEESGVPTLKSALSHHNMVLTGIWGIIGTTGASFMCALLPQHPMPGKPPQLQPWELSCTATASFSSNFRALHSDTKDMTPTGSCGYFVSLKLRGWNSAATSLDYSWMPITDKLVAFPLDR